jgi:ribonucleotide monophosphatase NagD (HAD superfamily)
MGIESGMDTALVFTGETTPEALAAADERMRPVWTLARIDQLMPAELWKELGWESFEEEIAGP